MLMNHLHLQLWLHLLMSLKHLHEVDFHDNLLVIEMSKSPLEQSNHYSQPPLQPTPIQRVIDSSENAVNPKRKCTAYKKSC